MKETKRLLAAPKGAQGHQHEEQTVETIIAGYGRSRGPGGIQAFDKRLNPRPVSGRSMNTTPCPC